MDANLDFQIHLGKPTFTPLSMISILAKLQKKSSQNSFFGPPNQSFDANDNH